MTTESQLRRALDGTTTVARKVLDVVPMQDHWTREQIVAELRRSGSNLAVNVIHGCLDNLRGRGLISEPSTGRFIRITAKAQQRQAQQLLDDLEHDMALPTTPSTTAPAPAPVAAQNKDPVIALGNLASQLRAMASAVEDAAMDVQQHIDSIKGDSEKLKQLQALLKGIS